MQTIREIGNPAELAAAINDAFPGSRIEITSGDSYFELEMLQHGLLRPLKAAELSDGTLRYLLLIAALLSPRPPDLMILNEPETSLHPDLLPPLARLIAQAARRAQIIVVSHAEPLVSALAQDPQAQRIVLEKQLGETLVQSDERPSWTWPTR
jgi:predicted ATPase